MREIKKIDMTLAQKIEQLNDKIVQLFEDYNFISKEIVEHSIFERKGGKLRSELIFGFGDAFNIDIERQMDAAIGVELLHEATLIHDDVIDNSDSRRNKATTNIIFGNKVSILTGDIVLSKMINHVAKSGNLLLTQIITETMVLLCNGEIMQAKANLKELDVDQYLEIIDLKTGSLIKASCFGPLTTINLSEKQEYWVEQFAYNFGVYFQMMDDMKDLLPQEISGKDQFNDLKELSSCLPVAIAEIPQNYTTDTLISILQNPKIIRKCYDLINEYKNKSLDAFIELQKLANFTPEFIKSIQKKCNQIDALFEKLFDNFAPVS